LVVKADFVVVVGLPRSGTTLLTTLLDQHPDFGLYYEPWNASLGRRPAVPQTLDEFRALMQARFGGDLLAPGTTTGFKETTDNEGTTRWAVDAARALAQQCATRVIWIQRDPIHCLLSKLEGAKKWWGYDDAQMSRETFETFLIETRASYRILSELLQEIGGCKVCYEALAEDPGTTLSALMDLLGSEFDPAQLEFYETALDRTRIMGDPSLIESPAPVSLDAMRVRTREADAHRTLIEAVLARPRFAACMAEIEAGSGKQPLTPYFAP